MQLILVISQKCQMLRRKILSLSNLLLLESETIFSGKNYFRKKKINYCYAFLPCDFQVICSSIICKNRWSPAYTETPRCLSHMD